jgi:hypothetical protein
MITKYKIIKRNKIKILKLMKLIRKGLGERSHFPPSWNITIADIAVVKILS